MQKFDMSKSVFYERYKPSCIEDLIIPPDLKEKLKANVESQDLPNIGIFSSLPGCLLPGTRVLVKDQVKPISNKEIMVKYGLDKAEVTKIRRYTCAIKGQPVDNNKITPQLLGASKLKGSDSRRFGALFRSDSLYHEKHLKVSYWVHRLSSPLEAMEETKRIRRFKKFFQQDAETFGSFNPENLEETLLRIKFKVLYSGARNIKDIWPTFDNPVTIQFWKIRGWDEDEAIKKIRALQIANNKAFYGKYTEEELKRYLGYGQTIQKYMDLGYSEIEAKKELSKRQSTFSLEKCVEKYGKKEGKRIWKERQIRWQDTLRNKSSEEIERINISKSNGYNEFLHPIGVPGRLYYIRFFNEKNEFYKIGITKFDIYKRFRFDLIEYDHEVIFDKEFEEIYDAFQEEQKILNEHKEDRVRININGLNTTEAFKTDVLEGLY